MKKITYVARFAATLMVTAGLGAAPAFAGTVHNPNYPSTTTDAEFSLSGATISLDTPSVWVDGDRFEFQSGPIDHVFACALNAQGVASGIESTAPGSTWIDGCLPLYVDSEGEETPFVNGDLLTAYRDSGSGLYSNIANDYPHIRVVSYVTLPSLEIVWVASASQELIPAATSEPRVRILPVLGYSGTSVVVEQQMVWELRDDWGTNFLLVCTDEAVAEAESVSDYLGECLIVSFADAGAGILDFDTSSGLVGDANYDPDVHGENFVYAAIYLANDGTNNNLVLFGSSEVLNIASAPQSSGGAEEVVRPAPYTGPVLNTPAITSSFAAGGKVVIPGSNLAGVSAVEIGGVIATVVVNSAGELEITVPAGLAAGTYDLVVVSSSGRLTVQNAITVSGSSEGTGSATPSTKRMDDDSAKVWVFDVVGAGKVQIFVNGEEIAWVNATDANDSKLFNGYLVRTVELKAGKNVIEVFVDGERERRTVYSN